MRLIITAVFAQVCLVIGACERANEHNIPQPLHIKSVELYSSVYGETRQVILRLPRSYDENWWNGYRVIYLLDGGYEQDFFSALGAVNAEENGGVIEPIILVGIPPQDRMAEYTPKLDHDGYDQHFPDRGGAKKHLEFIQNDVVPWVENEYNGRGRTIAGQSLGGLLVMLGYVDPEFDFDRYIAISPSLWWDQGRVLSGTDEIVSKDAEIYIALGHEQGLMRQAVQAFVNRIRHTQPDRITFVDLETSESHDSIYLTAFQDAVRTLFLTPNRVHPFQSAFAGLPDHPPPPLSEIAAQSLKTPCISIVAFETSYAEIASDPENWNRVCVLAKPGLAPKDE